MTRGASLFDEAVKVLTRYQDQRDLRDAYVNHLAAHPDGMWKSCQHGHVTASALVIDVSHRHLLLMLHRKLSRWLQMGGHCEPDDPNLEAAALREATEESGIAGLRMLPGGPVRLDRHPIPPPCNWHFDVQYAVVAPPGAVQAMNEESLKLRWFRFSDVTDIADESVVRLVTAARARI